MTIAARLVCCAALIAALTTEMSAAESTLCVFDLPSPILLRFNLTSLMQSTPIIIPTGPDGQEYNFGLCALVPCQAGLTPGIGATVVPGQVGQCLNVFGALEPFTSAPLDPLNPLMGVSIAYTGGVCQSAPQTNITVRFNVNCTAVAPRPPRLSLGYCQYVVDLQSPFGCGTRLPSPSGGTAKLSSGWVFIIFLLVAACVYLGGGTAYKRVTVGASGAEALPNIAFWRAFGANIHLGWVWVTHTLTCRPVPNLVDDDDLLYQGIRGDDFDGDEVKVPVRRVG